MTGNSISQKSAASAVCLDSAEQTTELIEALKPELAYLASTCSGLAKHCGEIKEAIRLSILAVDYLPRESGTTAISLFDYCDLHGEIESIATELSALAEGNHEAERVSSIAKRVAEHLRLGLLQIANLRMQGRVTHLDDWGNDKSTNSKRTLSPLVEHLVFPGVIEFSEPIRHFFEDLRLVHSDGEIPPALQSLMPNGIFLAHVLASQLRVAPSIGFRLGIELRTAAFQSERSFSDADLQEASNYLKAMKYEPPFNRLLVGGKSAPRMNLVFTADRSKIALSFAA